MIGTADKLITYLVTQDRKKQFEVQEYHRKRSLEANSYCWVLCDKIAKEICKDGTTITKEQVYKDAVQQIGTFESMIVTEKAYDNFKRVWESQGLGFIVQVVARQNKCVKLHAYYGSSTYDSKEMSLLINLLVDLAKALNIETRPQAEINSLINEMEVKHEKVNNAQR